MSTQTETANDAEQGHRPCNIVKLANNRRVMVSFATIWGKHIPDGGRNSRYRATICNLVFLDETNSPVAVQGQAKLSDADRDAKIHLRQMSKAPADGKHLALSTAMLTAAELVYGLRFPRQKEYRNLADFHAARKEFWSTYHERVRSWRNDKGRIRRTLVSRTRADFITKSIERYDKHQLIGKAARQVKAALKKTTKEMRKEKRKKQPSNARPSQEHGDPLVMIKLLATKYPSVSTQSLVDMALQLGWQPTTDNPRKELIAILETAEAAEKGQKKDTPTHSLKKIVKGLLADHGPCTLHDLIAGALNAGWQPRTANPRGEVHKVVTEHCKVVDTNKPNKFALKEETKHEQHKKHDRHMKKQKSDNKPVWR